MQTSGMRLNTIQERPTNDIQGITESEFKGSLSNLVEKQIEQSETLVF